MGQKLPPKGLEFNKRIDEVLFYKWDPIGISASDYGPRDEYQSYLTRVFKLALESKKTSTNSEIFIRNHNRKYGSR